MDIIGFINTQEPVASWTIEKKQAMLNDLASHFGYDGYITNMETPPTKKAYVNSRLIEHIRMWVNKHRKDAALRAATYEKLDISS